MTTFESYIPETDFLATYDLKYFDGNWEADCNFLLYYVKLLKLHKSGNKKKFNGLNVPPKSCLYGVWCRGGYSNENQRVPSKEWEGVYETKLKTEYPEFDLVLREFQKLYFKDFTYNQVIINRNYQCLPHKDKKNVGESIILGLGNYEGGALCVQNEDEQVFQLNLLHRLAKFDASKFTHFVIPFDGERYTLVFYNIKLIKRN